jgi:hypothetical protein
MSEKIKLTISPAVASYVRPGTPLEIRRTGCDAAEDMPVADRLMLLFCLTKDAEPAVRMTADYSLRDIPAQVITAYLDSLNPHPLVLETLRTHCINYPHPTSEELCTVDSDPEAFPVFEQDTDPEVIEAVDESSDEFVSKFKMAQLMGISEKIKMALSGDKEWRTILVKDANKLVSGSVIKNPRITEAEILTLIKSGMQNDEIMRLICANKEWIKSYKIRKALIENNRTPLQNATRYLSTMSEKDIATFAKSKNVSSVISTLAKRLLLNKKR